MQVDPGVGRQRSTSNANAHCRSFASGCTIQLCPAPKQQSETVEFSPGLTCFTVSYFRATERARKCFRSPFVNLQHHILARV